MRRKKLKIIEDYIFAKSLNLLAKNTIVSRENIENFNLINLAQITSEELLKSSEIQITKNKLNNLSFLILKKELENVNIPRDNNYNIKQIKNMMAKISK